MIQTGLTTREVGFDYWQWEEQVEKLRFEHIALRNYHKEYSK